MTSRGICQSVGMSSRKGEHFLFWTKMVRTKIKPAIFGTVFCLTGVCGGPFHLTRSRILSIRSPNYPSNYEAGTDCEWTLVGPAGHTLSFSFTDVSLPWSSNCSTVDHLSFVEPTLDTEGRTTLRGKYSCVEDLFHNSCGFHDNFFSL